jgi:hypothetical protein
MARQSETVTVLPSPRRLVETLRNVGYDFVGAVADLVDNCIAASAARVDIHVEWAGPNSWLRIADDGVGMDAATITEALRFGSERPYRSDDLGKFGIGLKTASLSQCRKILVASKSGETNRIHARQFDLDRIIKDDKWEVEVLGTRDRPSELTAPLQARAKTVVLWSQLDRILGFRAPYGEKAERALWDMVDRLELHLGMVFHRFIEGDLHSHKRKRLVITVNGNEVQAWNPFAPAEKHTMHLQARDYDIAAGGVSGVVTLDPWVLPAKERFSSEREFNRLSGPAKWAQQQGFYIYRANRLIQSGGWSRMRAPDEHTKLARLALDFFPELDAAFGLNIAKMRVNLPPQLRDRLKAPVEEVIRVAKRAYNPKGDRQAPAASKLNSGQPYVAGKSNSMRPETGQIASTRDSGPVSHRTSLAWPPPPLEARTSLGEALETVAAALGDKEALDRIRLKIIADYPEVADVLGW